MKTGAGKKIETILRKKKTCCLSQWTWNGIDWVQKVKKKKTTKIKNINDTKSNKTDGNKWFPTTC